MPDEKEGAFTHLTTVREADRLLNIGPTLVHLDDSLETIVDELIDNPSVHLVIVVDEDKVCQGVISLVEISEDVFGHLFPSDFFRHPASIRRAVRFADSDNITARDIMRPAETVTWDDTIAEAVHKLSKRGVLGLPIVDGEGRVEGYLSLLELLAVWLKKHE